MSETTPAVRRCETRDLAAVKDLFREFVEYHSAMDPSFVKVRGYGDLFVRYIEDNMNGENSLVLVAECGEAVVGYCLGQIMEKPPVYPEPRYGYIDNIAVREGYQRKGIGAMLVREMCRWFASRDLRRVEVFAAVKNPKSTSFWRKMGYAAFLEQMYSPLGPA